jgi:sulfur carrier protein
MTCQACATIVVSFNGEGFAVHRGMMLADFLQQRGYTADQRIATAINTQFVPKSQYAQTALNDGDRIDVVAPIHGG